MTVEKESQKLTSAQRTAKKYATWLGGHGGRKTAKKYGREFYARLGKQSAPTKVRRYGKTAFYALIRFGFKPSEMTEKEREDALAKIESDRADRLRRKKQETR